MPNFLTETAFEIPGTKVGVPRWALFGGGAALIVVLLMMKNSGATTASEEDTSAADETGGGLTGLEDLINELNTQPADVVSPAPGESRQHYKTSDIETDTFVEQTIPLPTKNIIKIFDVVKGAPKSDAVYKNYESAPPAAKGASKSPTVTTTVKSAPKPTAATPDVKGASKTTVKGASKTTSSTPTFVRTH